MVGFRISRLWGRQLKKMVYGVPVGRPVPNSWAKTSYQG